MDFSGISHGTSYGISYGIPWNIIPNPLKCLMESDKILYGFIRNIMYMYEYPIPFLLEHHMEYPRASYGIPWDIYEIRWDILRNIPWNALRNPIQYPMKSCGISYGISYGNTMNILFHKILWLCSSCPTN